PRPTYAAFRKEWDKHFAYETGFIVTSNEFFKLEGKWPLAFTVWVLKPEAQRKETEETVKVLDLTPLGKADLNVDWNEESLDDSLDQLISKHQIIRFDNSRGDIRNGLPLVVKGEKAVRQPRYDFSHSKKDSDLGKLVSGFPLKNESNHFELKRRCGDPKGGFIGFMDDNTPVRLLQDTCNRMSSSPDRIWLQLRPTFIDVNLTKIQTGPQDKYAYCSYDLDSAKVCFEWFCLTKVVNSRYPVWANQYNIWPINFSEGYRFEAYWYSLCFAFVMAENRCVVTRFEVDNPVPGAPEVFVDNPLSTNNPKTFWNTTLAPFASAHLKDGPSKAGAELVRAITGLYQLWNREYCKGQFIHSVGLQDEPYFRYFDYPDFLTPNSGLIQIRKFADINSKSDLIAGFSEISALTKEVREELYRLLVEEFKYFE
ncbi:MAG: hypothetical protein RIB86_13035, partial [Imperialibacter sp.]